MEQPAWLDELDNEKEQERRWEGVRAQPVEAFTDKAKILGYNRS